MSIENSIKTPSIHFVLLIIAICALSMSGHWGVAESSEARYAEISWEVMEDGDWLHPHLLKIQHFHKPPFTYWITAVAYHIFGANPFAARFFLQIALLIQVFLVYKIGQHIFNESKSAIYAACIYAAFPGVMIATRNLTTDNYLNTFILFSIFCWIQYRAKQKLMWLFLFYTSMGLGFFTKGPVVFIVPLVVVLVYNKLSPKTKFSVYHHIPGLVVMLTLAFWWFIVLYLENSQFLDYFVLDHTVNRFSTNNFGRSKPFWFYWLIVPATSLPWLLMLFPQLLKFWKLKFGWIHFFLCWIFIPLIFFSISKSKLILYVLPIYPGIALGAIYCWNQLNNSTKRKWNTTQFVIHILIFIALFSLPWFDGKINYSISMYLSLTLISSLVIGSYFYLKNNLDVKTIFPSFAFGMGLLIFSGLFMGQNPLLVNDLTPVTDQIREINEPESPVLIYNYRLPSVSFNLQQPVVSIFDGHPNLARETQFEESEDWKNFLIDLQSDDQAREKLTELIPTAVLITREEIPSNRLWLIQSFAHKKSYGKWTLYHH